MSNNNLPQTILAVGSDSFTDRTPHEPLVLKVYATNETNTGEHTAAEIHLTPSVAAEIISDLALALKDNAAYGHIATAINALFDPEAVVS